MALFQHEDALILGMLFAEFFPAYVYPLNQGDSEYKDWFGGGGGLIEKSPNYSTGRGGITFNKDGHLGVNGEPGRPGASDSLSSPATPSLCGDGGYLDGGGQGLNNGQLFFGGNASSVIEPSFGITSAGGGGGLFGGGSAFILAGGGGGSTWVYSNTIQGDTGWQAIKQVFPNVEYPEWLDTPRWIGIDTSTLDYYKKNEALFDVNTYHTYEYEYAGWKSKLKGAFLPFIDLHSEAGGNGLILISSPNKKIEIDVESGQILGINEVIKYSGECVSWVPPEVGEYEFILWGAQGGTAYYTRPDDEYIPNQSFTGGFGGSCGFFINLSPTHTEVIDTIETEVNTTLYLRVGQMGEYTRLKRAWNGGGNADTATGGGGSTDVRWLDIEGNTSLELNYQYRLAVAGGGGGCIGTGHGGPPIGPIEDGDRGNTKDIEDTEEDEVVNIVEDSEPLYFLVNDLSLVYVNIKYYSSASLPKNSHAGCLLYINNGQEGVLYQEFSINPVSGLLELVFPLDQVYPKDTKTHWVTLTPEVRTNTQFIVPKGGVHIRVETRKRVNEPNIKLYKPLVFSLIDKLSIIDTWNVKLVGRIEDIKVSVTEKVMFLDIFKVTMRAIEYVYGSVIEKLGIVDKSEVNLESIPKGDIDLYIFEKLKLVDMFKEAYERFEDEHSIKSDTASIVDSVNVKLMPVERLNVAVIEKLGAIDINNIKEGY